MRAAISSGSSSRGKWLRAGSFCTWNQGCEEANERWADTMLHEFGHAVYDRELDPELPWLLREPAHALTTEGIAMMFGRLVRDPTWLHEIAGLDRATVSELAPRLAAAQRASLLVFARWVLVVTHFERELYADPDADLDTLWWDLVERFQRVRRPVGRHAPDWAAKIHLAVVPVYSVGTRTSSARWSSCSRSHVVRRACSSPRPGRGGMSSSARHTRRTPTSSSVPPSSRL